jgi:FkbM family methyltransferase
VTDRAVRHRLLRYGLSVCRVVAWRLRGKLQTTVDVRAKEGLFTVSTSDQGVGAPLYVHRQFEYAFSVAAVQLLQGQGFLPAAGVVMVDVGANIGVISIGLVRAGFVERAVAVEPEPDNYRLLLRNVRQNAVADRIVCLQMAAGEAPSTLTMELSRQNAGDHRVRVSSPLTVEERFRESERKTILVPSLPLPHLMALPAVRATSVTTPSLVWIDVQGYEGYVFRGARIMLAGGLPTVSEIWPYGILRAGMSLEDFCGIVASIWSNYWVLRGERFIRYPVAVLDRYIDELGIDGGFGNVILTTELNPSRR